MRITRSMVLYTALAVCANAQALPVHAESISGGLQPLLAGDMRKLVPVASPGAPLEADLTDMADAPHKLSQYRGKYLLVNFWATWCAPCRREMPSLDRLEAQAGNARFAVIGVATGRNALPAMKKFLDEAGVRHITLLRDPQQQFARSVGILGLPATLILDPDGREIARMIGDAEWDGPEALALIAALSGAPDGAPQDVTPKN